MRAVALVLLAACNSSSGVTPDAVPPDAADGTACTTTTPRAQPVETFVGPSGLQARIGTLIDSAQTSLDVQMYLFTVNELAAKIVAAQQRGVAVRVIMDQQEAGNTSTSSTFTNGGVAWKWASTTYQYSHAKYLIIDRQTAVIMSMNLNVDAMVNERNYGMVDQDPEDVADVQAIFDYDWALVNGQQPAAPNVLSCTRLIISPVNSYQRLQELLRGVNTTLDVEALYVSDSTIRNDIGAAKTRGANVRVIMQSAADFPGNGDAATYFKNLGIPVKFVTNQYYNHAKLIIADGIAFVGSENYSYTSLTKNREVGALALEPSEVMPIQQQFDADWNITTPAP